MNNLKTFKQFLNEGANTYLGVQDENGHILFKAKPGQTPSQTLSDAIEDDDCELEGAYFKDVEFEDLTAQQAYLEDIKFVKCIFDNCDFSETQFVKIAFQLCKFNNCDFTGTTYNGSPIKSADLGKNVVRCKF